MFTPLEIIGILISIAVIVFANLPIAWKWVRHNSEELTEDSDEEVGTVRHAKACSCTAKSLSRARN